MEVTITASSFGLHRLGTALFHDLTERNALEVQLRHAQKMESIGQLAAGIAHEINTPIQFIGDNARFLKDEFATVLKVVEECTTVVSLLSVNETTAPHLSHLKEVMEEGDFEFLQEEIPRALQQSLDGVARVATIVRAMKEFSHPGASEKQAIDLNKALESTLIVSTNEWKYVADIETHFDPSLPLVPCLPGELNQVILNLLVNAAHAIADVVKSGASTKGKIRLSTKRSGDAIEIHIQDSGTGIPDEIAANVFDPFFTTKEVGKGTGQGLSIARNIIVDKHGGTIRFESEVGKGTTFFITLPLFGERTKQEGTMSQELLI